jgi:hypothetical protein
MNNLNCFDQGNVACTLNDAQSPIKETLAGMTHECNLALITHQENSILDSNDHSTNKTPTNEDAATDTNPTYQLPSSAQFRISVETNKGRVVVLDGGLIPYMKSILNITHAKQYCGLIMRVFFQETTSVTFLPLLRIIFKISFDRLNLIHQEVLSIEIATFVAENVSSFNCGHDDITPEVRCLVAQNTLKN